MYKLQEEIDKVQQGFLLIVRLLNKDELNILIDDSTPIINKFHLMVKHACLKVKKFKIIKSYDLSTLYIVVHDNIKLSEKLAYAIFHQVQLYVDPDYSESYFKCEVGSIKLPKNGGVNAQYLVSKLVYSMWVSKDKSFYHSYDENYIDIGELRAKNIRLNLLRTSILKKQANFMYQPVVDRKSGNIEYYECLLRIRDKNNKSVSIGPMIKDAEAKGLISIVDFTVIEMAVSELDKDKTISLSVNISNIGVLNKRLLKRIEGLLKKYNVADRLIIEITETSLNQDFDTTKNFINILHGYGCRIALDDFGSGFTSFKQLLNLPIDIIKIDGSYIKDILINNNSKFFVEALINLAKDLKIKTVAEFVENGEIAKVLIDIKIGSMQGNFFLPASENRLK